MELNKKGKELYKIWEQKFFDENDRLGGNSKDGDYVDGWCIIDNDDHIKTIEDECGLLIFAYEENAVNVIDEWIEWLGHDYKINGLGFTYNDVKKELLKYFE